VGVLVVKTSQTMAAVQNRGRFMARKRGAANLYDNPAPDVGSPFLDKLGHLFREIVLGFQRKVPEGRTLTAAAGAESVNASQLTRGQSPQS
jgi:hypothetical protein